MAWENCPPSLLEPTNTLYNFSRSLSMSGIAPVPYEGFYTSNNNTIPGDAWYLTKPDNATCRVSIYQSFHLVLLTLLLIGSHNTHVDGSSAWDIHCDVLPPFYQSIYHPTLEANISVNLANYGGATSLNLLVPVCSLLLRNSIYDIV